MLKKIAIILSLTFVLSLPLVGCSQNNQNESQDSQQEDFSQEEDTSEEDVDGSDKVEVVGKIETEMDDTDCPVFKGIVKNKTKDTLDYVEINFNYYDDEGNQIGTAMMNTTNLKGNGTWKFEAYGDTYDERPAEFDYTLSSEVY